LLNVAVVLSEIIRANPSSAIVAFGVSEGGRIKTRIGMLTHYIRNQLEQFHPSLA
jgi:hypothetical protein